MSKILQLTLFGGESQDLPNTEGLKEFQEKSIQETREKVIKAISDLKRSKKKITYKSVAEKACVSESTLYKHDDLSERIRQAKTINNQKLDSSSESTSRVRYKSSKDKKILELKEQITKYRNEISDLKDINAKLLGNLEKKTNEVIDLKTRLKVANKTVTIKK